MSIVNTWALACETPGCPERTGHHLDLTQAIREARAAGWSETDIPVAGGGITVRHLCPACTAGGVRAVA